MKMFLLCLNSPYNSKLKNYPLIFVKKSKKQKSISFFGYIISHLLPYYYLNKRYVYFNMLILPLYANHHETIICIVQTIFFSHLCRIFFIVVNKTSIPRQHIDE